MKKGVDWEMVSFLNRAKRRKQIFMMLDKPHTPTEIKIKLLKHFTTSSRGLIELQKKGLVKCLNPLSKYYRYYGLTSKGKKVKNQLKNNI